MSEVINVTDERILEDILSAHDRVVVKFTAPAWCRPCQQFAPVFKAVASEVDGVKFVSVDVDNAPWAMANYGVQGVPTVVLFEGGSRSRDLKERTALKFLQELG